MRMVHALASGFRTMHNMRHTGFDDAIIDAIFRKVPADTI